MKNEEYRLYINVDKCDHMIINKNLVLPENLLKKNNKKNGIKTRMSHGTLNDHWDHS